MVEGLSEEDFARFEHAVYEAALVPERWPDVLTQVGEISNSAGAAILCVNERGVHIASSPSMRRVSERFINENWVSRNSRVSNVLRRGLAGLPRFINEDEYFPADQLETDPMVNELFRAEGLGWAAGFMVDLPHGDVIAINVEQYYERGPIRGADLARLDSLFAHLARSITLSARSDFERVRTAIDTVTALGLPGAAVTPAGRVILANDEFAKATHVWTTRGREHIALHDRTAGAMLTDILAADLPLTAPRSIAIRSETGGPVVSVLQVLPIRRAAHDIFGAASAIIVLSELARGAKDATLIQSLFDLSQAEIDIAKAIAAGRSVAEIARARHTSLLTVRNQLKTVMAKTGSKRQVELALLVRQLTN